MAIKWDEPKKAGIRWDDAEQPTLQPPKALSVLGAPEESRDDMLRRKAQEDLAAGMSLGERLAVGFDRGVTRLGQAVKQTGLHLAANNPLTAATRAILPASAEGNIAAAEAPFQKASAEYDAQLAEDEKRYQMGLGKDTAANVAEFLGGTAATLPLGGPAGKVGGSILGNALRAGAVSGAVSAATTPVDDAAAQQDFAGAKARQAAIGGAVGGGLSATLQGAGKVAEEVGLGNLLRRGYNALASGANAKPAAAEGERLAQKFGVELTPGQVSGGKSQLAVENLARQSIFSRDKVFETDMKIADQYAGAITKQMDKLAKGGGDAVSAGSEIKATVNDAIDKLSARRSKLARADFGKVDELARGTPIIEPANYKAAVSQIIDENSVAPKGSDAHALAEAAKELLSSAADNGRATNALKTRRYLSQIAGGQASFAGSSGQPVQKRAAAMLLGALDQDIEAAAGKNGALGAALKEANERYKAYSQRINAIKEGPIGRILGEDIVDKSGYGFGDVAPEQIYKKFTELHPSQVELAMQHMSPQAQGQVKRAYVQKALESAQMETASGGAVQTNIRPGTFIRNLQRDGNTMDRKKLRAIFKPDELTELDELMNLGRRIGDRTGENTSGTAVMAQTMGVLEKLRSLSLKGLGEVAGAALGTREIARIMADSGGRRALLKLRSLPPGSAEARKLAAYVGGLAAAKEDE